MISMTTWINIIKRFGSKKTKDEIRTIINDNCLLSNKKRDGCYLVDDEKVWKLLVEKDPLCLKGVAERRIQKVADVESWLSETGYQQMRKTFPRNHHRKMG